MRYAIIFKFACRLAVTREFQGRDNSLRNAHFVCRHADHYATQILLGLQPTDRRMIAEPETRHIHRLHRCYT